MLLVLTLLFIGMILYVSIKLLKRRFGRYQKVFGTLKSKEKIYVDQFSISKQYQENKEQLLLHFELAEKKLSLYCNEVLYNLMEPMDSGYITHNNSNCIDFEKAKYS